MMNSNQRLVMNNYSNDDVTLFMEDFWPSYQKQKFPIGQAFFNFLQADMHYSFALKHYTVLMMDCSEAEHMKYIKNNAS